MKRPGVATVLSLFLNALLSAWLFQQYLNDQYFHNYVDSAVSPVLPYLILTMGIGGGSSLGYLLLRRKHSQTGISGKLQKARPLKQSGPLPGPTGGSLQSKNVPAGAPPGPISKHTAYAVPSLSKPSSQTGQKTAPPTSWSMTPKQLLPSSTAEQRQEQRTIPPSTSRPTPSQFSSTTMPETPARLESGSQSFSQPIRPDRALGEIQPSQLDQRTETPPRPSPFSTPPTLGGGLSRIPPTSTEPAGKTSDKTNIQYTKPFTETPQAQSGFRDQSFADGVVKASQPQSSFQQLRPQPPDSTSKPAQWTDPVPRQGYAPPQKWSPPSVSPVPSSRPPTPMGPPGRLGQLPQNRPQFAGQQGPPRPLAYPGSMKPPPIGTPGPFRPDQARPLGAGAQQRPPVLNPRPMPTQLTPQSGEKKDWPSPSTASIPSLPASQATTQPQSSETPAQTSTSGEPSSGEMDWDTALDTILKTLRKDKVGDKP